MTTTLPDPKHHIQLRHPVNDTWALVDTTTGRIVSQTPEAWDGVPIRSPKEALDILEGDNVVPLTVPEPRGLVPVLTDLLAKATRGEIVDGAFVIICADGDVDCIMTPTDSFYKLLGALDQMKFDMLKAKGNT